ncbi:4'-phosphopantetheinyl transferase family protein [Streptomyces gobiensis]|uniref:4'-phosphopantetheinyl transferase family protein n=1 Tax=Streptomyces gobiensis TaxID=2875706 RepID=UPI001E36E8B6|nr:4'-phosphopantetheinyl transferase superfamily protein [Streptomyces gobiensis]UGY93422.1 4'-phosphopantetheinyl transferase superfamily protein [Streptomyces gobiensis]
MSVPTAPATDTAQVWWWHTADTVRPADLALLNQAERLRAARIRLPQHAGEFVSCRAAVRRILASLLGVAPTELRLGRRPCPGCGSADHGPPTVVAPECDWWISIAHSSGAGLLAVADAPVGVDLERSRKIPVAELSSVALSPTETARLRALPRELDRTRAFLRSWTRKEAVLKAAGVGITTDLTAIEAHPLTTGPVTVTVPDLAKLADTPVRWSVTELPMPTPWSAAIALPADRIKPVQLRAHP